LTRNSIWSVAGTLETGIIGVGEFTFGVTQAVYRDYGFKHLLQPLSKSEAHLDFRKVRGKPLDDYLEPSFHYV
jgi:hypothetical protein